MIVIGFLLYGLIIFSTLNYQNNAKQIIQLVYFHFLNFFKKKNIEVKNTEIPYEYKYIDIFDNLKLKYTNSEYENKNSFVMENTPDGNVLMNYNYENESFFYYCDNKNISYKYLETVARKFIIQNKCFKIYIDMREELKKDIKTDEKKVNDNVFAKLKNYKINKKRLVNETNKQNKKMRIKEYANKYTYKGKLNEFKFFENSHQDYFKNQIAGKGSNPKNISYQSFKNNNLK